MSPIAMDSLRGSARILVVDDEPANLRLLDKILTKAGYAPATLISDAREVLPRCRGAMPDLILLDLNMPHLDGHSVLEQLRSEVEPGNLPPVIVLTAQAGREHVHRSLAAGARDFVSKPFDRLELLMRVRNLLEAHWAQQLLRDKEAALETMVQMRTRALEDTRLDLLRRLGVAAEYRDNETGMHLARMSQYSQTLARSMGWSHQACELILHASPMHDVGKIGIPDAILLKPGKLTPDEWEVMKRHTLIAGQILQGNDCEVILMARDIAMHHHEKWDGSGYPHGLSGEAIPAVARIVAVADVFDALTSSRPYKSAWSIDDAVAFIKGQSGVHFDPVVVDHFLQCLPEIEAIKERLQEPDVVA